MSEFRSRSVVTPLVETLWFVMRYSILIFGVFFLLNPGAFADEIDVSTWLAKADSYRLSSESTRVDVEVTLYKGDKLEKRRRYQVYLKPARRSSLVLFKSPGEMGQKVLMVGSNFHLFLPRSRRAIRITPMQKLLGDAATGDLASMTWREDYSGVLKSSSENINGIACDLLALSSRRRGTTYDRIELYLQKETHIPVFARLYLKSGKLAKEASYTLGHVDGREMIIAMTLVDRIRKNRKTIVNYRSIKPLKIPNKYYNPQYLLRARID